MVWSGRARLRIPQYGLAAADGLQPKADADPRTEAEALAAEPAKQATDQPGGAMWADLSLNEAAEGVVESLLPRMALPMFVRATRPNARPSCRRGKAIYCNPTNRAPAAV